MNTPVTQPPISPEFEKPNLLEYPIEYFDAQVRFAHKWSELTGEAISEALQKRTALARRINEVTTTDGETSGQWTELMSGVDESTGPEAVTNFIYESYSESPASRYKEPEEESAFGYDYQPETRTVKIHFTNPVRGERPLNDANMPKRRIEFQAMLQRVREEHPEAALLMSATWLRSTKHYRDLSPPDIAEQVNLVSPDMKLTGNSVWGQFINTFGNVNQRVYDQFIEALEDATNVDELVDALPYKTLRAVDPIKKYYDYYGVDDTPQAAE